MPKIIDVHLNVKIVSVKNISSKPPDAWNWRKGYIGMTGRLAVCVREHKHAGKTFIKFISRDNYDLTTGYGDCKIENGIITMKTQNSIYTFEIIEKEVGN